jgi:hypothetical protein
MLDLRKLDNLITNIFIVIILVLIDMIIRNSEMIDVLYLLFMCGCFACYLLIKYKK